MDEASKKRHHGRGRIGEGHQVTGIMVEASEGGHIGGLTCNGHGVMGMASWRRHQGGIMEETAGIMEEA